MRIPEIVNVAPAGCPLLKYVFSPQEQQRKEAFYRQREQRQAQLRRLPPVPAPILLQPSQPFPPRRAPDYYLPPSLPVASVAPSLPVAPMAPMAPVAPVAPMAPMAPVAPVAPMAPVAPVAPVAPMAPMAPVAPMAPMAPVAPVAPMAPMASVASVAPMAPVVSPVVNPYCFSAPLPSAAPVVEPYCAPPFQTSANGMEANRFAQYTTNPYGEVHYPFVIDRNSI